VVLDAATGAVLRSLEGHTDAVRSIAYGPDGRRLVSGSDDGTVKVWDMVEGRELRSFRGHGPAVRAVAFNRDGKRVAGGGADRTVRVWDADTGRVLHTLPKQEGVVEGLAFSPDGKRLASATNNGGEGNRLVREEVRVWDLAGGRPVFIKSNVPKNGISSVWLAYSPDGKLLAGARSDLVLQAHEITLWNAADGSEVRRCKGYRAGRLAFSRDGKRLADAGDRVSIWNLTTGRVILTLPANVGLSGVAFSPDGKRLAAVSGGGVQIWDATAVDVPAAAGR
jgi:WD40 repeat protein